ncbi:MAG TPA: lysophospholipid acyltransferase family protein [Gammaproteobacteria bacterium]|nr:lysophospholipid acyltransferase family protein [Gammaproteobacteria bacterium]
MSQSNTAVVPDCQTDRAREGYTDTHVVQPSLIKRGVAHMVLTLIWLSPRAGFRWLARHYGPRLLKRRQKRYRVADVNLGLCFPQISATERQALVDDFARKLVFAGQDVFRLWWGSPKTLTRRVRIEGGEYLDAAQKSGRPVVLLVPHTVGLEIGGLALAARYPMLGLTSEAKCGFKSWAMTRLRRRFADCIANRAMPVCRVLSQVRSGRILYYLPDEDHGHLGRSHFVPFFGQPTSTLAGTGRMLSVLNPLMLPCTTLLDFETGRYTVKLFPPVEGISANAEQNCALIRRELEKLIRLQPADYLWTMRMFNNCPDGSANPAYPDPTICPSTRHSREGGTKSAGADLNSQRLARRAKTRDGFRNPS